jgi:uncharacterized protein (TIGR02271 family)
MASTKNAADRATVVGVFHDRGQAQAAVQELRRVGFREDQIGVVARHSDGDAGATKKEGTGSHMAEGAGIGLAAGAGVGALWALGIVTLGIPAIGPAIAGGIFASILASAAGGAAVAGIAGALIGLGIPRDEASYYEEEFKAGRTLVTVKAESRYAEARDILRRHGAYDHENRRADTAATSVPAGSATHAASEGQTVKVHEERLHAEKRPVNAGEVRVRKEVVTEHQTVNVPTTREEVVVERRPTSGQASASDIKAGEEVRIPVKEEKVNVQKEAVVTEEVNVGKRQVTENQQVGGTVRKERVHVEEKGDVDVKNRQK